MGGEERRNVRAVTQCLVIAQPERERERERERDREGRGTLLESRNPLRRRCDSAVEGRATPSRADGNCWSHGSINKMY